MPDRKPTQLQLNNSALCPQSIEQLHYADYTSSKCLQFGLHEHLTKRKRNKPVPLTEKLSPIHILKHFPSNNLFWSAKVNVYIWSKILTYLWSANFYWVGIFAAALPLSYRNQRLNPQIQWQYTRLMSCSERQWVR